MEIDEALYICATEIFLGDFGVFWIELQRDELAVRWKGAGEPDGAVTTQGADLQDASCVDNAGDDLQEFTLRGRNSDRRQAGRFARFQDGVHNGIRRDQRFGEIVVDRSVEVLRHWGAPVVTDGWFPARFRGLMILP